MEEVVKLGKKLEKMAASGTSDHTAALDILNTLKKQKMTLDILQKSRIGMTVNSFRKSTKEDAVVSLAKSLIKGWKKLLPTPANGGSSPGSLNRSVSTASTASSKADDDSRDTMDTERTDDSSSQEAPTAAASGEGGDERSTSPAASGGGDEDNNKEKFYCAASETDDPVRLKCRDLLTNALKTPPLEEGVHDPASVAAEIEDCIFDEFRNTEVKYKNRIRSRIANLRDSRNPELRQNVLIGLIAPQKLASMTSEEMASNEMKELRVKLTKEAINDHQMSTNSGTVTDMFKCGKCGKYNCTYTQLQTRSSDEPMTTFVLCNNCGNRWKFC